MKTVSIETRKKMSQSHMGRPSTAGMTGKHHSKKTRNKMKETAIRVKTGHWMLGKETSLNPTYGTIHNWLRRKYGKANHCESQTCTHTSPIFEWSLVKGKKYERKRENFWQLCRKCHHRYDDKSAKVWSARNLKTPGGTKGVRSN